MRYIFCPFDQKDLAKSYGAMWDANRKSWYIPDHLDPEMFAQWLEPAKPAVQASPSAGKQGVGGLYVDLVPRDSWWSNLRKFLSEDEWDTVRRKAYREANHVCSICSGRGDKHPVEAHERWGFNPDTGVQSLIKVESLCPACHEATHIGLAGIRGRHNTAKDRLKYVNNWTDEQAEEHIKLAFQEWELRNQTKWKIDVSWVNSFIEFSEKTKADLKGLG